MKTIQKKDRPIGVFDSGLGGISVLKELMYLLPRENYIFYADAAHTPYGERSIEELEALTTRAAETLIQEGVKAILIACNTATSAAGQALREKHPELPIIGIEPAVKPAVLSGGHPTVVVMATHATLRQEKYRKLLEKYKNQGNIYSLPAPGLVTFVEQGELDTEAVRSYIREGIKGLSIPDNKIDAVVLGCTHFPFVRSAIESVVGKEANVYDGAQGAAQEMKRRLKAQELLSERTETGTILWQNSKGEEAYNKKAEGMLALLKAHTLRE
ncbi:glutamate racemase [Selenomonas sp. TAMA-11512]|uniref:glutamate racemase n=1 Tax=Selenomonas sp. TAMA-11512 TaxID=3095337 RepID=UPI0030936DE5|nr:glutamate racemase [Selenomonas sp. TAMA-11512]